MRRNVSSPFPLALVAAVAMCATPAVAGEAGTHLIAELNLGLGIPPVGHLGPGPAYGGLIGIGGKFKDFPPRFYFVAGASSGVFAGSGTHPEAGVGFEAERTYVDLLGGLRVVIPVYDMIRVYVDVLGGALYVDGSVVRRDGAAVSKQDWSAQWAAAVGLDYRWHFHASTGIRLEGVFGGGDVELLDVFAGDREPGWARINLLVSQTWHL